MYHEFPQFLLSTANKSIKLIKKLFKRSNVGEI